MAFTSRRIRRKKKSPGSSKSKSKTTQSKSEQAKPFMGNREFAARHKLAQMVRSHFAQAKEKPGELKLGTPNDKYEVEADQVAEKVTSDNSNTVSQAPAAIQKVEEEPQAKLMRMEEEEAAPAAKLQAMEEEEAAPAAKLQAMEEEEAAPAAKLQAMEEEEAAPAAKLQAMEEEEAAPAAKLQAMEEEEAAPAAKLQAMEEEEAAPAAKLQAMEEEEAAPAAKLQAMEEEEAVNQKSAGKSGPNVNHIGKPLFQSKGNGKELPADTRKFMESKIGADFKNVKIHTDATSVQMNKDINAQAFTHGKDIYFNQGKFDTESNEGKKLLAHELTHVVQQNKDVREKGKD